MFMMSSVGTEFSQSLLLWKIAPQLMLLVSIPDGNGPHREAAQALVFLEQRHAPSPGERWAPGSPAPLRWDGRAGRVSPGDLGVP